MSFREPGLLAIQLSKSTWLNNNASHVLKRDSISATSPYSLDCTATWPSGISLHRVQRPWRKTLEHCTHWNQFLGTVKIVPLHLPWLWGLSACWSGDFFLPMWLGVRS